MSIQKILIVGNITGHFRSQLFIQKLLHKDVGSNKGFIITLANPKSFQIQNCNNRLVKYFLNIINFIFFLFEIFIKIPFSHKIYFMALNHRYFPVLLLFNLIWRRPIIADMYVSIYDGTKDRNNFKGDIFKRIASFRFEWYYKLLDKLLIEKPFKTIYIGDLELKLVSELVDANINKSNYVIIPPASLTKKKAAPSSSTKLRICWWGTYIPLHGVENIIEAAHLLKKANINFSLDLFGTKKYDGSEYKILTRNLNLEQEISFHTDKTFGNGLLEKYLVSNCDLVLGNFSSSERAQRSVPTKIFDAFSMCLPVLTMNTKVLQDSVDVDNDLFTCGINPEEICEGIIKIMNNKQEKERRANNGFVHYEKTFSVKAVQEKFIKLFL